MLPDIMNAALQTFFRKPTFSRRIEDTVSKKAVWTFLVSRLTTASIPENEVQLRGNDAEEVFESCSRAKLV